jgi:hypothetical protein
MNDGGELLVWHLIEQRMGLSAFLCGVGFYRFLPAILARDARAS